MRKLAYPSSSSNGSSPAASGAAAVPAGQGPSWSLSAFIARSAWFGVLTPAQQALVLRTASEKNVDAGEAVLRVGDPSTHWLGVAHGLLHMYLLSDDGRESTLACIAPSEWCGEGSLIKSERRRYNAIALQPSGIALVPLATFNTLREESIGFNHFLQAIMNERMSGFIELLTAHRFLTVEQRVAQCVAMLGRKQLAADGFLTLGQQQIALICGLSRQRVNAALGVLEQRGLVSTSLKGLCILNLAHLQAYGADSGLAPPAHPLSSGRPP